ncbi:MAG: hypothetical protein ABJB03_06360 [Rhodoglobus sp.]
MALFVSGRPEDGETTAKKFDDCRLVVVDQIHRYRSAIDPRKDQIPAQFGTFSDWALLSNRLPREVKLTDLEIGVAMTNGDWWLAA